MQIREGGTPSRKRSSGRRTTPDVKTNQPRSPLFPPRRPEPPPLEGNDVKIVTIGTLVWAVAFASLLPFYDRLVANEREWWLWTCLAGLGLGLFGIHLTRRRRGRLASRRAPLPAEPIDPAERSGPARPGGPAEPGQPREPGRPAGPVGPAGPTEIPDPRPGSGRRRRPT